MFISGFLVHILGVVGLHRQCHSQVIAWKDSSPKWPITCGYPYATCAYVCLFICLFIFSTSAILWWIKILVEWNVKLYSLLQPTSMPLNRFSNKYFLAYWTRTGLTISPLEIGAPNAHYGTGHKTFAAHSTLHSYHGCRSAVDKLRYVRFWCWWAVERDPQFSWSRDHCGPTHLRQVSSRRREGRSQQVWRHMWGGWRQ